jgi:hypothetical protein
MLGVHDGIRAIRKRVFSLAHWRDVRLHTVLRIVAKRATG